MSEQEGVVPEEFWKTALSLVAEKEAKLRRELEVVRTEIARLNDRHLADAAREVANNARIRELTKALQMCINDERLSCGLDDSLLRHVRNALAGKGVNRG